MYRYAEEEDRSLEASAEASELLFNCECGDDASRVKCGEACACLEKLGKTCNPSPQEVTRSDGH